MSDHAQCPQEERRVSRLPRLSALIGTGAALGSVALVIGVTVNSGPPDMLPEAVAAPTSTTTTTTTTTSGSASGYSVDSHGYVDSDARCDDSQIVMAYGRTDRALVAICVDSDGALEYRGERLSDGASLQLPATRGSDGMIIATNDTVTYTISPKMFLVSEGDTVLYRDAWVEFVEPSFSDDQGAASTSENPTTTVPTTTVTVTTSVTPTSSRWGD